MKWPALVVLLLSVLYAAWAACGIDYSPDPPYYYGTDQCQGVVTELGVYFPNVNAFSCCTSQKIEDCSLESQFRPCSDPASLTFTQDGSSSVILAAFETNFSMVSYYTHRLNTPRLEFEYDVETSGFSPRVYIELDFNSDSPIDVEVYAGGEMIGAFERSYIETDLDLASRDISSLEVRYSSCGQSGSEIVTINWAEPRWDFIDQCFPPERSFTFSLYRTLECPYYGLNYELIIPDLDYFESFQDFCDFTRDLYAINNTVVPSDIIVNIFDPTTGHNYTAHNQFNILQTTISVGDLLDYDSSESVCPGETMVIVADVYSEDGWTPIEVCNSVSGKCSPVIDRTTALSFEAVATRENDYPVTVVLEHCSGAQIRREYGFEIYTSCNPEIGFDVDIIMITEDQGIYYYYEMYDFVPGVLFVDGQEFPLAEGGAGIVSKDSVVFAATYLGDRSDIRIRPLGDTPDVQYELPQLVTYNNGTDYLLGYVMGNYHPSILSMFKPNPVEDKGGQPVLAPGEYTLTMLYAITGEVMEMNFNLKDEWPRPTVEISGACVVDQCTNITADFTFTNLENVEYRVRTSSSDPSWSVVNTYSVDIDPSEDTLLIAEYRINERDVYPFTFDIPHRKEISVDSLEVSASFDLDSCSVTLDVGDSWAYHHTLSLELDNQEVQLDFTQNPISFPIAALGSSMILGEGKVTFGYSAVLKNPCGTLDAAVKKSGGITSDAPVSSLNVQVESLFSDDCSEYFGTRISWDPLPFPAVVDAFIAYPYEGPLTTDIRSVKDNTSAVINAKTREVIATDSTWYIGAQLHAPCGILIPVIKETTRDELFKCVPKPPASSSSSSSSGSGSASSSQDREDSESDRSSDVSGASKWILAPMLVVVCVLALL